MFKNIVRSLLYATVIAHGPVVWAWGDTGHRTICQVAFDLLDSGAQAEIQRLIDLDPDFDTLAESCTWPDHPRRRGPEHFVNVTPSHDAIRVEDCPLAELSCSLVFAKT